MKKLVAFVAFGCVTLVQAQTGAEPADVSPRPQPAYGMGLQATPDALRLLLGREMGVSWAAESLVGLYLKPYLKLGSDWELYGRLGGAQLKRAPTFAGSAQPADLDVGLSYGAGVSYTLTTSTRLTADYMQIQGREGFKVKGLSLGVGLSF